MCVLAVAELRIRPPGDSFTKPVGGSVVMTCSVEAADGREIDNDVVLSWVDGNGRKVTATTGRYYEVLNVREITQIH